MFFGLSPYAHQSCLEVTVNNWPCLHWVGQSPSSHENMRCVRLSRFYHRSFVGKCCKQLALPKALFTLSCGVAFVARKCSSSVHDSCVSPIIPMWNDVANNWTCMHLSVKDSVASKCPSCVRFCRGLRIVPVWDYVANIWPCIHSLHWTPWRANVRREVVFVIACTSFLCRMMLQTNGPTCIHLCSDLQRTQSLVVCSCFYISHIVPYGLILQTIGSGCI